jgi:hypothetical protein
MALPIIFAEKERVDPGGVAAHNHVLIVIRENLGLDEVARTQQVGHCARLAHGTEGALAKTIGIFKIGALQFFAGQR